MPAGMPGGMPGMPGGMPDMGQFGSMMDNIMQNPQMREMAEGMMQNPQYQQMMQNLSLLARDQKQKRAILESARANLEKNKSRYKHRRTKQVPSNLRRGVIISNL